MRKELLQSGRHDILVSLLLVTLLFRASVPVGFMPASGTPFLLELCPAAAPMVMSTAMGAHHHHHSDTTHTHYQSCPFGSAPAVGPVSHLIVFAPPAPIALRGARAFQPLPLLVRRERAHSARGPPFFTLS